MLSDSEYFRAVDYIEKFRLLKMEREVMEDNVNKRDLNPERKKIWEKELTDCDRRLKEIEISIQKEFGYLIKDPDIKMTPLKLEHIVNKYEQERERERTPQPRYSSDLPQEINKQPPLRTQEEALHGVNRYIKPTEPKSPEHDRPKPEPEQQHQPQAPDYTLKVTHPEQKPKGIPERYLKAIEQQKHHEREHRHDRYRDSGKEKSK